MKSTRISIVTPSFNQSRFIERTISSVLDQAVDGLEYVVCDGGSTDSTIEILRRHEGRLQWLSEPDRGQADAINKGIVMTRGEIIGWLNSDDVYRPGALDYVRSFFDAHEDVEVIYGDADHIDANDAVLEAYYTEDWNYERLQEVCFICQPSVFFRRRLIDRVGLLDVSLQYCMDYDYWLRIGRITPFVRVPFNLAASRLHQSTKTLGSRVAVHSEINDVLKRRLGEVPTRWLHNYAFAVYDSRGWGRPDLHRHALVFSSAFTSAFLRWRRALPPSAIRTLAVWLWSSWRAAHGNRGRK